MRTIVVLLAVMGVIAILRMLARSVFRLGMTAAEESAAAGLAEVSARRGDLTGLAERTHAAKNARGRRRRNLLLSVLWLAWLAVPPFLGVAAEVYALAAPLWLIGSPGARSTQTRAPDERGTGSGKSLP